MMQSRAFVYSFHMFHSSTLIIIFILNSPSQLNTAPNSGQCSLERRPNCDMCSPASLSGSGCFLSALKREKMFPRIWKKYLHQLLYILSRVRCLLMCSRSQLVKVDYYERVLIKSIICRGMCGSPFGVKQLG